MAKRKFCFKVLRTTHACQNIYSFWSFCFYYYFIFSTVFILFSLANYLINMACLLLEYYTEVLSKLINKFIRDQLFIIVFYAFWKYSHLKKRYPNLPLPLPLALPLPLHFQFFFLRFSVAFFYKRRKMILFFIIIYFSWISRNNFLSFDWKKFNNSSI